MQTRNDITGASMPPKQVYLIVVGFVPRRTYLDPARAELPAQTAHGEAERRSASSFPIFSKVQKTWLLTTSMGGATTEAGCPCPRVGIATARPWSSASLHRLRTRLVACLLACSRFQKEDPTTEGRLSNCSKLRPLPSNGANDGTQAS